MWARFQTHHDQRFAAGIDEVPAHVVDGDVNVADARRYFESAFAKHWNHAQVLRSVLNKNEASRQRFWERRIDDELGGRFVLDRD
jgi:hypothetical protein